jgi:hypothetical protein
MVFGGPDCVCEEALWFDDERVVLFDVAPKPTVARTAAVARAAVTAERSARFMGGCSFGWGAGREAASPRPLQEL